MAYMVIHCGACGGRWEVYHKQRDASAARYCPHCSHVIGVDTWKQKILPAYDALGSANEALGSDSVENHRPEFSVDIIADTRFENAGIGEIKNAVQELTNTLYDRTVVMALAAVKGVGE